VQFARCIQHVLERVLGLHLAWWSHIGSWPPTATCSPWVFLVLYCSHLPTAILSVRLLIFALAAALLIAAVVAVVFPSLLPTEALIPCVRLRSPW
jgi:hypothetical protein